MTLTEFLLARIAEDAEHARVFEAHFLLLTNSSGRPLATTEPLPPHMTYARVLAECEAKRRIVEMAKAASEAGSDGLMTAGEYARDDALDDVLRLLALPYADREGFREEWRA